MCLEKLLRSLNCVNNMISFPFIISRQICFISTEKAPEMQTAEDPDVAYHGRAGQGGSSHAGCAPPRPRRPGPY